MKDGADKVSDAKPIRPRFYILHRAHGLTAKALSHAWADIPAGLRILHRILPFAIILPSIIFVTGCRDGFKLYLPHWSLSEKELSKPVEINFPEHLNPYLPSHPTEYLLRTSISLPLTMRNRELKLVFPSLQAIAKARIDGQPVSLVDEEHFTVYRRSFPNVWRVPARLSRGVLTLEVEAEHRWVKSAWEEAVPYLIGANEPDCRLNIINNFNRISLLTAIVALLLISLTSLMIWLMDRRLKRAGWMSFMLILPVFLLWFELGSMQMLFGVYDTAVTGVTLTAAIVFSANATHAKFGLGKVRRFWPMLLLVNIACALFFPGPFIAPLILAWVTVSVLAIGFVYQLTTISRLLRPWPQPPYIYLEGIAWILLVGNGAFDMVTWVGWGELLGGVHLKGVALMAYALLEFVDISMQYTFEIRKSDQLNQELKQRIDEIQARQREIQKLNDDLQNQIKLNEEAYEELKELNKTLEQRVDERTSDLKNANQKLQENLDKVNQMQQQMMDLSRRTGMMEVANTVLHNVGNVLNSVNVSTGVLHDIVAGSRISSLEKVVKLIRENENDIGRFFTEDEKGQRLPKFLQMLNDVLIQERNDLFHELELQRKNIEYIKVIIQTQQQQAKVLSGQETATEAVMGDLIEDAIRVNLASYQKHGIEIIRELEELPAVKVDRHKLFQILMNLLNNASHAVRNSGSYDRQIKIQLGNAEEDFFISVEDNGYGIAKENLNRIFTHGFTTKRDGYGFGLHGSALAAKEMGGAISVFSDGPGKGATFKLTLPRSSKHHQKAP